MATAGVAPALRRIGDVADATGLTQRAIRYYEEVGLLAPAAHASGGNRRYDDEDVERLLLIKRLREVVGLSLAEIHTFLETETERRAVVRAYRATTDAAQHRALLDRVEPVLRRRIDLLLNKLDTVQALLDEERARLARVHAIRNELTSETA
jgi:DNA-binding transcriptional MerR regulator